MTSLLTNARDKSAALATRLRDSGHDFIVTGASGWLGRATLELLADSLGDEFPVRVTALGSQPGIIPLRAGRAVTTQALSGWQPDPARRYVLLHYAFLTKDKVAGRSAADYSAACRALAARVRRWYSEGAIRKTILASSGAVYDALKASQRDPDANLYGQMKLEDEAAFATLCQQTASRLVIPRIFNLSGPYVNKLEAYALAAFIVNALRGEPIRIQAQCPVLRSYVHIGNLLAICLHAAWVEDTGIARFDTAGPGEIELTSLAQRVCRVLEREDLPIHRPAIDPQQAPNHYVGDRAPWAALLQQHKVDEIGLDEQIRATAGYLGTII